MTLAYNGGVSEKRKGTIFMAIIVIVFVLYCILQKPEYLAVP